MKKNYFIDCANIYGLLDDRKNAGTSEKILGEAIIGKREQLVITSKVSSLAGTPPNNKGTSRYYILNQIEWLILIVLAPRASANI